MSNIEKIYKRANDIKSTLISFDSFEKPITDQNWIDLLDKCRLLISQYNILYDEFQRDASLKNVAVFPKIDILNELEFRENAEQIPNMLSISTHDQLDSVQWQQREQLLSLEEIKKRRNMHQQYCANQMNAYKSLIASVPATSFPATPTSSSKSLKKEKGVRKESSRKERKKKQVDENHQFIKSKELLPQEMKVAEPAPQKNNLFAAIMTGKSLKTGKKTAKQVPPPKEENTTSRAYFVKQFQKHIVTPPSSENDVSVPAATTAAANIPAPSATMKIDQGAKVLPTTGTANQTIQKRLLVRSQDIKPKVEPTSSSAATESPKAANATSQIVASRANIATEARSTPIVPMQTPQTIQISSSPIPSNPMSAMSTEVSLPTGTHSLIGKTRAGTPQSIQQGSIVTTPAGRPTIANGAQRYTPYGGVATPTPQQQQLIYGQQQLKQTTPTEFISNTPTNLGSQSQTFNIGMASNRLDTTDLTGGNNQVQMMAASPNLAQMNVSNANNRNAMPALNVAQQVMQRPQWTMTYSQIAQAASINTAIQQQQMRAQMGLQQNNPNYRNLLNQYNTVSFYPQGTNIAGIPNQFMYAQPMILIQPQPDLAKMRMAQQQQAHLLQQQQAQMAQQQQAQMAQQQQNMKQQTQKK